MGFYLTHIFESILLFMNAMAILNEPRFLRKYGLSIPKFQDGGETSGVGVIKNQLVLLLFTVRTYGRYFLIPLNVLAILLEFING